MARSTLHNLAQPRAGLRTPVQMGGANGEWVEVCWLRVGLREVARGRARFNWFINRML